MVVFSNGSLQCFNFFKEKIIMDYGCWDQRPLYHVYHYLNCQFLVNCTQQIDSALEAIILL